MNTQWEHICQQVAQQTGQSPAVVAEVIAQQFAWVKHTVEQPDKYSPVYVPLMGRFIPLPNRISRKRSREAAAVATIAAADSVAAAGGEGQGHA